MSPPLSRRDFAKHCAGALALASLPSWGRAQTPLGSGVDSRVQSLDRAWTFARAGESRVQAATLPHCVAKLSWQKWDPASWAGAWEYRRSFGVAAQLAGQRLFLEFDAVLPAAALRLNGSDLAPHFGGYLPFSREITGLIRPESNELVVRIDSSWQQVPPDGAPRGLESIDFHEPAGIIRSARLRAVPRDFIADVFAKPVQVLDSARRIDVEVLVDCGGQLPAGSDILCELRQGDRVLASATQRLDALAVGAAPAALRLEHLGQVDLWDVDHPHLYWVHTTLRTQGKPVHRHRARIGLRDARFELDGFFLNGRRLQLFGLNRHELYPYTGFAMPPRAMRRDAEILKHEFNLNSVRCCHYPHSPAFLDACDELGLLAWEEIPGWHYVGGENWQDLAVRNVTDMVRRDRNRPSVAIWGVRINESPNSPALYRLTSAAARALDDSRPVSGAIDGSLYSLRDWSEDLFAYNDYNHPGPGGDVKLRPPLPGVPYVLTEAVGQIVGPGPGATHKYRRAGDPAVLMRQAIFHAQVHDQAAANPRYCGVIAWAGFDYGSPMNAYEGVKCPGVADSFRIPKPGAAFYQAQVDPSVRVVIQPDFFWDFGPKTPRGPGAKAAIFSNCDELRVYLGDTLHETLHPAREAFPHVRFAPSFAALDLDGTGSPELRIEGYVQGRLAGARRWSSDRSGDGFTLQADDQELSADGADATRVAFRVTDRYGNDRAFAGGEVRFSLEGPAVLVGDNPFQLADTGGVGAVWVRAESERGGTAVLRARHSGLGERSVEIRIG